MTLERKDVVTYKAPSPYALLILGGLSKKAHVYAGTVPAKTIARRRRRNHLAALSRKANR